MTPAAHAIAFSTDPVLVDLREACKRERAAEWKRSLPNRKRRLQRIPLSAELAHLLIQKHGRPALETVHRLGGIDSLRTFTRALLEELLP